MTDYVAYGKAQYHDSKDATRPSRRTMIMMRGIILSITLIAH